MDTQGYGKYVQKQIQGWPISEPVTTAAIATSLARTFDIDVESAKKITNVNMKRLADKGELARIQKGIYGKVKETPFGKLTPGADEMLTGILLRDDGNIIGYIAGPTLLNTLGLCSWMPKERHIATNRYRYRIPDNATIRIHKPIADVNDENAPYLRALEAFTAMDQYPVDAEKPGEILRGMLRANHVDNEKLIWYARSYCGHKTLLKTIDITLAFL